VLACLAEDPRARPTAMQVRDLLRALDERDEPGELDAAGAPPAAPTVVGAPALRPVRTRHAAARRVRGTRHRGRVALVVAAVLGVGIGLTAVLLLTRGGDGSGPVAGGARPAPTTAPEAVAPPSPGVVVIDAETDDRFGTDGARFASPSGNIGCRMTRQEVRCDLLEQNWQVPPAPQGCTQAEGTGAVLAGAGEARLTCPGDTVADPALPELAYGSAVRFDGVLCVSRKTGMRCQNEQTGHGFEVARASYALF
jgi:hypothetical protein